MVEGASDSLSSIFGWVSIACWIVVYSPQIYENYVLQSGEGLSVLFVVVWLLGDLSNLFGALMAGLLPTVIILALYYTFCDIVLLAQIYYYRRKSSRPASEHEQEPLLPSPPPTQRQTNSTLYELARYTATLLFIVVVGVLAWWIGSLEQDQDDTPPKVDTRWQVQFLGWLSAILYLGARVPQIAKNFKTRCEGLHPALFFYAIFGNVTYALSICVKSMDAQYLLTNAGWLAGSALTVFLDATVLCQIFYYRTTDNVGRSQSGQ